MYRTVSRVTKKIQAALRFTLKAFDSKRQNHLIKLLHNIRQAMVNSKTTILSAATLTNLYFTHAKVNFKKPDYSHIEANQTLTRMIFGSSTEWDHLVDNASCINIRYSLFLSVYCSYIDFPITAHALI